MTELSGYWTTDDTTPEGHQVSEYTQAHTSDAHRILAAAAGYQGVVPGFLNELACSDGGANTVDVATGGAVVDGKWYMNDAVENVNIPSASGGGNTRIDRIVLRANWSAFTVEIHRIAGTDAGSPTAPAVNQASETSYDIKLCQVLVDTGGDVTVTDEREWATIPVDNSTLERSSGGDIRVKGGGITASHLASSAVETAKINNLAVTTGKIANNAVDDTKVGDRVLQFYRRQGGSATVWSTTGTTTRTPGAVRMQAGAIQVSFSNQSNKTQAITFPTPFANGQGCLVFFSIKPLSQGDTFFATIDVIDNQTVTARLVTGDGSNKTTTVDLYWLAIGPE